MERDENPQVSCAHYCGHALDNDQYDQPKVKETWCTLYPEWRRVSGHHFCGQHTDKDAVPKTMNERRKKFLDQSAYWREAQHQRDRAIAAEKALKEARKTIRTLKVKPTTPA